ncbi:hypothetical protein CCO0109 [Campylobacter coli RM2228]|nr:hypothetical protein CCO0092 [Campylobacter coli RM2228]EAL56458.1 hypothetical protein CCO0102 [Campylobacter coli RM2228]EAL56465.1 hypothetical protein CCO0109 [Campylobacter coli RM2228]
MSLAKKSSAKTELVSKEVKAKKAKIFFIENPFINSFCKFFKGLSAYFSKSLILL